MNEFEEVKESINVALEEIKKQCPELYDHLKKTIIMDEQEQTFKYEPSKS